MKKTNYYFTLALVLFTTVFSFFNMFQIVKVSSQVIQIVFSNLLPSLLPFMILISLCLSLHLFELFSYFIQYIFSPLFHLTPHMATLYFVSFFCGYPTNAKIIKESYEMGYINIKQLQHMLSIASFSSLSFIFVSLALNVRTALILYICHVLPSILRALCYREPYEFLTFKETIENLKTPSMPFVTALKKSITSSLTAFIFILGYMLDFQFVGYSLNIFVSSDYALFSIQEILEFSYGAIQILKYPSFWTYPIVCFFLSFSGFSVLMQVDNILEGIPYSFQRFFFDRLLHGILSFIICCGAQYLTLL